MYARIHRWSPALRPEPDGDARVFLLAEAGPTLLRGPLFVALAPLLDGRRSVGALVEALAGRFPAAMVLYGLMQLERAGHITTADARSDPPTAPDPRLVERMTCAGDADPMVYPVADLADPRLDGIAEAHPTGRPWVAVALGGRRPLMSPIFAAGGGEDADAPCHRCLRDALMHNRPVERYLSHRRGAPVTGPPRPVDDAIAAAAADAFGRALKIAVGDRAHPAHRAVARFDAADAPISAPLSAPIGWHPVRRRPQCPGCGVPLAYAMRAARPVRLMPRPKVFTHDGGHRVCSPDATLARLAPLVDPLTGVVARLEPVEGRNHPQRPVYSAAWRICPVDRDPGFDDFDRPALGKGRTEAQARVGALCEALERHGSTWRGDEPTVDAALGDLPDAIHPDALQLFGERQYAERAAFNAAVDDARKHTPPRFDPAAVIPWTPAWRVADGQRRHLPAAWCHAFRPRRPAEQAIVFDPNGHAAGNCLEEAILQGLLERIERDAVGIWWYGRCRRRAIDLDAMADAFDDDWFITMRSHHAELGSTLWVLDLRTDLGIPVCAALARRGRGPDAGYCVGFGAHLDGRLAAQRAVTELNQLFNPARMPSPWDHRRLRDAAFLDPAPGPAVGPDELGSLATDDITADVERLVDRLAAAQIETLVIDQTRPDIPLATVKVITPGLRHFWPRLGPGRLYTVPVACGWRAPFTEDDIDPVHLFL